LILFLFLYISSIYNLHLSFVVPTHSSAPFSEAGDSQGSLPHESSLRTPFLSCALHYAPLNTIAAAKTLDRFTFLSISGHAAQSRAVSVLVPGAIHTSELHRPSTVDKISYDTTAHIHHQRIIVQPVN
jgi:hypothetical protein